MILRSYYNYHVIRFSLASHHIVSNDHLDYEEKNIRIISIDGKIKSIVDINLWDVNLALCCHL